MGRDEKRAPLKTPAWEATGIPALVLLLSTLTVVQRQLKSSH